LLAIAISAVSFGTVAQDKGQPEKIEQANTVFSAIGINAEIIENANGDIILVHGSEGNQKTLMLSEMTPQEIENLKLVMRNNLEGNLIGVNPIDPGFGVDPIDPGFGVEPIPKLPGVPVTREEAIQYVKDGNAEFTSSKLLDEAIAFRMNNEDKYEFTAEQKVEAVNRLIGDDRLAIHTDASGQKQLMDKETGQVYTADQVEAMAKEARAQVQKEAQKRAEEREITNPVEPQPPVEQPVVGLDPERAKEAVQNLVEYGSTVDTRDATQQLQIDNNTLAIEDLYNQIGDLDAKIDGVMASTQAVTAARPYLGHGQTSSVGVGLGAANGAEAIAVGYAHRINDNWTANANVSLTNGNDTDASFGAGVSYAW